MTEFDRLHEEIADAEQEVFDLEEELSLLDENTPEYDMVLRELNDAKNFLFGLLRQLDDVE